MDERQLDWQLVLPGIHRRNAVERSIRTFKKHFKSILATTDESFPMHIWCRLIPQSCTTLSLMRNSIMKPEMSAEAQLNEAFGYNHTFLVPPGTKAVIHEM